MLEGQGEEAGESWAHPAAVTDIPPGADGGGDRELVGDIRARNLVGDEQRSTEAPSPEHGGLDVHENNIYGPARMLLRAAHARLLRRTRDYCRAYLALEKGGDIESKDMIKKMKIFKANRNILDMEPGFIDKQLQSLPTSWTYLVGLPFFFPLCGLVAFPGLDVSSFCWSTRWT